MSQRFGPNQPPLRVTELANMLGCSRRYVHKLIGAGVLQAGKLGNRFTISPQEAGKLASQAGIENAHIAHADT